MNFAYVYNSAEKIGKFSTRIKLCGGTCKYKIWPVQCDVTRGLNNDSPSRNSADVWLQHDLRMQMKSLNCISTLRSITFLCMDIQRWSYTSNVHVMLCHNQFTYFGEWYILSGIKIFIMTLLLTHLKWCFYIFYHTPNGKDNYKMPLNNPVKYFRIFFKKQTRFLKALSKIPFEAPKVPRKYCGTR